MEGKQPLRFTLAAGGILLALALAVVMLRFHRLGEIPSALAADERLDGDLALQVLQGEHAVYFPVDQGRDASAIYALALSTTLLGRTLLAMQLPTALGSAGMVFVAFWLGWLLFGRDLCGRTTQWRGLVVGGVAAGLMAVSIGQTVLGRSAYNKITHMPFLLALCLGLAWQGWRRRSWWLIVLAGACAGLLPYTYIPARFTPFLFLLFGLSFIPLRRSAAWRRIKAELPRTGIFLCVAGLVAAPILIYFALHPEHFFIRSSTVSLLDPNLSPAGLVWTFLLNVGEHLLVFGFRGDPHWRHNFAGQPLFNVWQATFFWIGVGMAVWRWQRPAYRLLLLWLVILFLPALLSNDNPPNTMRMMGAAPAIYLLAGVGAWEAFLFLKCRFSGMNGTMAAAIGAAILCGLIVVQGVLTFRAYFDVWATAPEVHNHFQDRLIQLARTLNPLPSDSDTVYLISGYDPQFGFDNFYKSSTPAHIIEPSMADMPQHIEAGLATMSELSTVNVVDWKIHGVLTRMGSDRIIYLLDKYGDYIGSNEFADFHLRQYENISMDRSWTFYERLDPLTVHYDGGISLLGFALGQGKAQLSTPQRLDVEQAPPWLALQWQTAPGLDMDYAISLRLFDAEGIVVFQQDAKLKNPKDWPTGRWSPDKVVDTLHRLEFPADIPPGDYELRLVVYDVESLKPTVELGVWEPEAVMANVQMVGGQ